MGKACSLTSSNWASASQLDGGGRESSGKTTRKAEKPAHCEPVSQDFVGRRMPSGLRVARPNCLFMERPAFRNSFPNGPGPHISLITQMLIAWPAVGAPFPRRVFQSNRGHNLSDLLEKQCEMRLAWPGQNPAETQTQTPHHNHSDSACWPLPCPPAFLWPPLIMWCFNSGPGQEKWRGFGGQKGAEIIPRAT